MQDLQYLMTEEQKQKYKENDIRWILCIYIVIYNYSKIYKIEEIFVIDVDFTLLHVY